MSINFYSQLKKNLQGELRENFDLSKSNWLGIGGKANFFFKPKDLNDLQIFLRNNNQHFPIIVIGSGSNLLIRDKGFEGVVIKFGKNFDYIKINNEIINCGPATQKTLLAETAANNNLTGFEFLYCIPGTIAGGIVMNSGCYGSDNSDKKAWELIKESGCADLRVGGIKLSKLHCNFLENLDGATSEDAENLIENIKQQVFKKTNINLELELEVVGKK